VQTGYNDGGGSMKKFEDMVGKSYWHYPSGLSGDEKRMVVVTSIIEYKSIKEKKEWAWVTETNLFDYKDAIRNGCVFNAVDLFNTNVGEFPCWDFELSEIK